MTTLRDLLDFFSSFLVLRLHHTHGFVAQATQWHLNMLHLLQLLAQAITARLAVQQHRHMCLTTPRKDLRSYIWPRQQTRGLADPSLILAPQITLA